MTDQDGRRIQNLAELILSERALKSTTEYKLGFLAGLEEALSILRPDY